MKVSMIVETDLRNVLNTLKSFIISESNYKDFCLKDVEDLEVLAKTIRNILEGKYD